MCFNSVLGDSRVAGVDIRQWNLPRNFEKSDIRGGSKEVWHRRTLWHQLHGNNVPT
jgi:hypothetical protein